MGLAKKGSSLITVDGHRYRWVVSGNDGFLDLLVEHEDGKGQRLGVQFDYDYGEMTPGGVRTLILAGLDAGWKPRALGKQIEFRLEDGRLIPMDAVRRR